MYYEYWIKHIVIKILRLYLFFHCKNLDYAKRKISKVIVVVNGWTLCNWLCFQKHTHFYWLFISFRKSNGSHFTKIILIIYKNSYPNNKISINKNIVKENMSLIVFLRYFLFTKSCQVEITSLKKSWGCYSRNRLQNNYYDISNCFKFFKL